MKLISYVLYDKETGEIMGAHQSEVVSNPLGYGVKICDDLLIGIEATHRIDVDNGDFVEVEV